MTRHILLAILRRAYTYISLSIGGDNEPNESLYFSVLLKNDKNVTQKILKISFRKTMTIMIQKIYLYWKVHELNTFK